MERIFVSKFSNFIKKSLGERAFNYFFYYYLHVISGVIPKKLNLKSPQTFSEKIIWLKMHYRHPNARFLVDKCTVREFVSKKIGEHYLIPLIYTFDQASEIDFNKLPNAFVLKTNHGSGFNIIVRSKDRLNIGKTIKQLENWMKIDYYQIGKEYQYKGIEPRIICETYLENSSENPLIDYKFFCFSGDPKFIQVDIDRFTKHKRNFYNMEWQMLPFTILYPLGKKVLPKPEKLSEMITIAKSLSEGSIFSRVDMYYYKDKVYFGEITFDPGGGFPPFKPKKYDYFLGEYLHIDEFPVL